MKKQKKKCNCLGSVNEKRQKGDNTYFRGIRTVSVRD